MKQHLDRAAGETLNRRGLFRGCIAAVAASLLVPLGSRTASAADGRAATNQRIKQSIAF
jgi:hypothetical protein